MITVDSHHQFDWLTVSPEEWPRQYAQLPGRCGPCGREVEGTLVTNARGPWEHFECAEKAYKIVHHGDAHIYSGTQREFIEFVQEATQPVTVSFERDQRRDRRYRWWVS